MERLALAVVLGLFASGCGTAAESTAPEESQLDGAQAKSADLPEAETSEGFGGDLGATERCSEESVRSTVESFVEAYNKSEPDLTERFFAGEDRFQWYSEHPDRMSEDETGRATLDSYLAQRQDEGGRLRLVELNYNGFRAEDQTGHFDFVGLRNDIEEVSGKGAIDCRSGGIMVWSLGPSPGSSGT